MAELREYLRSSEDYETSSDSVPRLWISSPFAARLCATLSNAMGCFNAEVLREPTQDSRILGTVWLLKQGVRITMIAGNPTQFGL